MNTVLVRRNDENAPNEQDNLSACRRIVVKVKRKNSPHIDATRCDELQRSALSNLNIAHHAQAFVHLSKRGGSISTNVVVKSASNRVHHQAGSDVQLGTHLTKEKTTTENIERRTHKGEATAMTTTTQLNDKLCQYSTSMSMLHQQQEQENKDLPVFQNEWLLQTKRVTRALTRAQKHRLHVDTSNRTCHPTVANPEHSDESSADKSVLRKSENVLKPVSDDFSHVQNPSIGLSASSKSEQAIKAPDFVQNISTENLLVQINDYDVQCARDPCHVSEYAADIFNYFKEREKNFKIGDFMMHQSTVTTRMRIDLIDWLASTQDFFALNLETLFLSVKLVDLILSRSDIKKETLQLLGAAALLLAAKYEETAPPTVNDLVYISDDAFTRDQLLRCEFAVYRAVDFDLGIPLSYHFVRRYARCAKIPMSVLTLARYILETSLMNYALVSASDSKMAAASLFMALRMTHHNGWNATLAFYSGYAYRDFAAIIPTINAYLHEQLFNMEHVTIRTKYSRAPFFKVAEIPLMTTEKLIENADSSTSVAVEAVAVKAAAAMAAQNVVP